MTFNVDLSKIPHHQALEEIVDVLCNKTQNIDRGFFRAEVAYFLGKVASNMGATLVTLDRGEIPINIYALALATSGFGKGHSVGIIENQFLKGYKSRFMNDTFLTIASENITKLSHYRAARSGLQPEEELEKLEKEFKNAGAFPFTFDSGTAPAVKQLRHKLLLAKVGAINLQIDEIGSNLINNTEVLTLYLELFDQGMVKQKLTKNTAESQRTEEIDGKTPTNMLLFGTPAKLLDGSLTEDHFYGLLETGYARRCIFGMGIDIRTDSTDTPEEAFDKLISPVNDIIIDKWAYRFEQLANPANFGTRIEVEKSVGVLLLSYKMHCEKLAEAMPEHEEIRKAELSHRYFKALKLAGAYAYVDQSLLVEEEHLLSAIKLVEESGEAFQLILNREKSYVKLAKYIIAVGTDVTHPDLIEALPFYKNGVGARNEQMSLAIAWAYKQHSIIKRYFVDGNEFFSGESLKETDLNKVKVAYSNHWAYDYEAEEVPFDQLHTLTEANDYHWTNHAFAKKHRAEENVIQGFNLVVIDVDEGVSLDLAHDLLKEYKFMTYTTKRHTAEQNRFRIILPMNFTLNLDQEEYKEFMNGIMDWLPFKTDPSANQRAKKWMTNPNGSYHYNDGELLDARLFIPKTSRNEQHKQQAQQLGSLDNMERWFANKMAEHGNRNNHMLRFAMALKDSGMSYMDVSKQVHSFNSRISDSLPKDEIDNTILTSVAKKYVNP